MVSKSVSLMLLVVLCKGFVANKLSLKRVFIFSRHNIRYPLGERLHTFSSQTWPPRPGPPGMLSAKGAQVEGYIGEYFSEWFKREQFLSEGCPDKDAVYVYANTATRTKATARAFIDAVFKNCNVPVHHKNTTETDPLFAPVIHNTTEAYKNWVLEEVNRKLHNNCKLQASLSKLNKILEIEESQVCKQDGICDLTGPYNRITYKVGEEMWVEGPVFIGISSVDSFVMSYYNGEPMENVAWGKIKSLEDWRLLTEVGRQDHYIRYETVAEDIAAPLVEYFTRAFKNNDDMPKLTMLMGHDYNMNSFATALGFQSMDLPNQFEKFPIGSKFVFQRWTDNNNTDYFKAEYVYPSWSQLRNGSRYSEENPPQRVVMRLNWCPTDEFGFCPWKDFVDKL